MKKGNALAAILCMTVLLAGCGSSNPSPAASAEVVDAAPSVESQIAEVSDTGEEAAAGSGSYQTITSVDQLEGRWKYSGNYGLVVELDSEEPISYWNNDHTYKSYNGDELEGYPYSSCFDAAAGTLTLRAYSKSYGVDETKTFTFQIVDEEHIYVVEDDVTLFRADW